MTCKLLMVITFAMVVRLRPTIYQNSQNWKENPWEKRDLVHYFFLKTPLTASNLRSKIKHPIFFKLFKLSATIFYIMCSSQFVQDNRMFNQFHWSKFNRQLGNSFNGQLGNLTQTLNSSNKQNSSQTKFK